MCVLTSLLPPRRPSAIRMMSIRPSEALRITVGPPWPIHPLTVVAGSFLPRSKSLMTSPRGASASTMAPAPDSSRRAIFPRREVIVISSPSRRSRTSTSASPVPTVARMVPEKLETERSPWSTETSRRPKTSETTRLPSEMRTPVRIDRVGDAELEAHGRGLARALERGRPDEEAVARLLDLDLRRAGRVAEVPGRALPGPLGGGGPGHDLDGFPVPADDLDVAVIVLQRQGPARRELDRIPESRPDRTARRPPAGWSSAGCPSAGCSPLSGIVRQPGSPSGLSKRMQDVSSAAAAIARSGHLKAFLIVRPSRREERSIIPKPQPNRPVM